MKPGIAHMRGLLLLAVLLLAARAGAQDDANGARDAQNTNDGEFLDMLEFIGEFSSDDGEWEELDTVEGAQPDARNADADKDDSRDDTGRNRDLPARPQAGAAGRISNLSMNTATEAL